MSLTERLLTEQNECSLCWVTRDGTPAATTVSFVYFDECVWMTALESSARVKAIKRNPKVALVITGKGSPVGHSRCVSLRGECDVIDEQASRDAFFPAFADAVLANSKKGARMMAETMNSPENAVLHFRIKKTRSYDSQAMYDAADQM